MTIKISIITLIISITFILAACDSDEINDRDNDSVELIKNDTANINVSSDTISVSDTTVNKIEQKILQTIYICPLGDTEGNSDKAGVCPICEMELIENPDYIENNSK